MSKKIIFFILLFNLTGYAGTASSKIIQSKKPIQTAQETQKKLLIDTLKPLPKPIEQAEKKVVEEKVIVKKENKDGFILPKKKPLIAGTKKVKDIKISKYYNKKDFNLAKKAISEIKRSKWTDALRK